LLGPSGCGKTTILRLIAGFETPDAGTISLDGNRIETAPPEQRPVNTVFQSYALFPHMTVAQNVAFSLTLKRLAPDVAAARVRRALEAVDLADLADRSPVALSGGQQQRVAVARALARQPQLLIADEPTAELDLAARTIVLDRMLGVAARGGAVILATHDAEVADRCDHVLDLRVAVGRLDPVHRGVES
jgi:spermidine/putrescine transport system ATP-binding protein